MTEAELIQKKKQEKLSTTYKVKDMPQASVKDVDVTKRVVTGFFNTFNFFDSDMDVLVEGSAKRSINNAGPNSEATAKIKHALHHDLTKLPGKIEALEEKTVDGISGIFFETRMADTTLGNDTLINYQEKVFDNHSIGFKYKQLEFLEKGTDDFERAAGSLVNPEKAEESGMLWLVKEIELFEGSTVAFGANSLTPFLGVKSGDKSLVKIKLAERIQIISKQLRHGKQSDETMKSFEIQLLQIEQMIKELDFDPPKEKQNTGDEAARSGTQKSGLDFLRTSLNI